MASKSGGGDGKKIDPKVLEGVAKDMATVKVAADAAADSFQHQLEVIMQIRGAMEDVAKNVEKVAEAEGLLTSERLAAVAKELERVKNESSATEKAARMAAKAFKSDLAKAAVVAQGALSGMGQGFKNTYAIMKAGLGVVSSLTDMVFSVGKSILSIPFKVFEILSAGVQRAIERGIEIRRAYEQVRQEFGDLKSSASSAVIEASKSLKGFRDAGLTTYSVFGNTAERIKFMTEMAKGMGAQFNNFTNEMRTNGGALAIYQKGLGITSSDMEGVAQTAARMGTSMSSVLLDTTKQSMGMAKAFGVNAKVVSRDMGRAMKDLANFGHLSTREIGLAAAYANKLGISIEKLTGMMSATQTFDQAAEGMAKLNEQYGTNIDATKVMMAQSPAEKFAIISKGFRDAGKDLSKLTYQDRAFIKAQTGMEDSVLNAMIANKDAGAMYDKMSQQADRNTDKTLVQAKAMKDLAKAVERVIADAPGGQGFFGKIMEGISRGIQTTPEFNRLIQNMSKVFMDAFHFGVKLGKMFVDLFPGVKQMINGLADIFNPATFHSMFSEIVSAFDILKAGGPTAVTSFMERIKEIFDRFLGKGGKGGGEFLEGLQKFGETFLGFIEAAGKWLYDKLKGPIKKIVSDAADFIMDAIKNIPEDVKMKIGAAVALLLFGPAVIRGMIGGVSAGFMSNIGKVLEGMAKKLSGGVPANPAPALAGPAAAGPPASEIEKQNIDWGKVLKNVAGLAAVVAIGLAAFFVAMGVIKAAGFTVADALTSAAIVTTGFIVVGEAALAALVADKIVSRINDEKKIAVGLLKTGAVIAALVLMMKALILGVKAIGASAADAVKAGAVVSVGFLVTMEAAAVALVAEKFLSKISWAPLLKGLAVMTVVTGFLGLVLMGLVALASQIKPADLLMAAAALAVVSFAMLSIVGVVFGALAVGLVVANPFTAAALVAGMAALAAVVATMAIEVVAIMKKLSQIKESPDAVKTKSEAFASILKAVASMMEAVARTVEAMNFSMFERQSTQVARMEGVQKLIKTIIVGEDNKGGIKGIIDQIIAGLVQVSPERARSAEALATVLSAIGALLGGIGVSLTKLYEGLKIADGGGPDTLAAVVLINNVKKNFTDILDAAKGFVDGVITSLDKVGNASTLEKVASAVSSVIGAVTSFMGILIPNLSGLKKVTDATKRGGSKTEQFDPEALKGVLTYVGGVLETVNKYIPQLIETMAGSLIKLTEKISNKDFNKLQSLIELVKSIGIFAQSLGTLAVGGVASGGILNAFKGTDSLTQFLDKVKVNFPTLIQMAVGLVSLIPDNTKSFSRKFSSVISTFDSIKTLAENITGSKIGDDASAKAKSYMKNATALVSALIGSGQGEGPMAKSPIEELIVGMTVLSNQIAAGGIRQFKSAINHVQVVLNAINQLDTALATLSGAQIGTRLKKINEQFDLGSKGDFSIKNKEVSINLNFQITMSASDVEKAIVFRKDSVVRDRINLALGGEQVPAALKVNTPNPQLTTSKIT